MRGESFLLQNAISEYTFFLGKLDKTRKKRAKDSIQQGLVAMLTVRR